MYIKNNTIAVIFRVIFLIACGAGLVIKLIYSGFSLAVVLGDFALIANTLALIYFAYLITARPGNERGALRGAVTIYMLVTFIVYCADHIASGTDMFAAFSLGSFLLYLVSPVMAVCDYILFCRKGSFTSYSPLIWAAIPVLFNAAVFIVNRMGAALAEIPYFDLTGSGLVITLLVFFGIGYLLFAFDSLTAGRRR